MRDGNYGEMVAVDFRSVAHKPSSLKHEEAAAIPLTALTGLGALLDENFEPYKHIKTVLIIGGAGGTGSMTIQYLKAKTDITVIATASSPQSVDWVKEMEADYVVDHSGDVKGQLSALGFNQVDQIFSTSHTTDHLHWMREVIRRYGHLSLIENPEALKTHSFTTSISIHWEMVFTRIITSYLPELQSRFLSELSTLIDAHKIKSTLTKTLSGLSEANIKHAHTLIEEGHTSGKIVITDIC